MKKRLLLQWAKRRSRCCKEVPDGAFGSAAIAVFDHRLRNISDVGRSIHENAKALMPTLRFFKLAGLDTRRSTAWVHP
ncbi:MAG: hypothetical protein ACR2RA_23845 [Geminicoccaceae bacterium]